ncbi:MAG: UDP-N-acetylmuramoyl-L-alanyl-D-glutamate--2,6-diaminopimelate ligase [Actinomycetota bacterium]|nr:UDP-N-acetylmuramoyl-L-alanyl-D-glutamate--2,6-diaminopimelate ligase [Actinomycetota bacterium]
MKLKELLKGVDYKKIYGSPGVEFKNISINSKDVNKESLFVAVRGFKLDGHDFIKDAVDRGASLLIVQEKADVSEDITQVIVNNTRKVLPVLCKNFYRDPTASFELIGVTGTNGKTTTCYIINSILKSAGRKTSLITTVESFIDDSEVCFDRTTPESNELNDFFSKSKSKKVDCTCMEVSSHSVDLNRVDFLKFNYLVFTNLSQDHLDYHKDMKSYFYAKKQLFLSEKRSLYYGEKAVINMDDSYGMDIYKSTDLDRITFSLKPGRADIWPTNIKSSVSGIKMTINTSNGLKFGVSSSLCGNFNIYNILSAAAVCIDMGVDENYIKKGISSMSGVKGRFERVYCSGGFTVIVDYAHTPDGLKNVLETAGKILPPGGKLISVFGCGGDRDKGKRKAMGHISGSYADYTIITSDNPRSEDPVSIINMVEEGIKDNGAGKYASVVNRKKAIFKALGMAAENDVVIIAGKGHERYQEFKDDRIPFCDWQVVKEWTGKEK